MSKASGVSGRRSAGAGRRKPRPKASRAGIAGSVLRDGPARATAGPDQLSSDTPYRLLFQRNPLPMWVTDFENFRFLAVNDAALQHYGYTRSEFLRLTAKSIRPPEDLPAFLDLWEDMKQKVNAKKLFAAGHWRHRKKNGTIIDVEVDLTPITFEGRLAQLVLVRDVTEQRRAEATLGRQTKFVRLLQEVAVAANQASTVDEALVYCLERVCFHTGWELGHAYLLAPDSDDELLPTQLWWASDPERFAPFQRFSATLRMRKGVGLPGLVLASGKPEWLREVTSDAKYPRKNIANQVGIRAAFGFPILIGSKTVGVLEFFLTQPREPDEELLDVVAHIGAQIGRVIERSEAETRLREREARLQILTETMPAILWTTDRNLRFTSGTGAGLRAVREQPNAKVGMTLMDYVGSHDPEFRPIKAHRRVLDGETDSYEMEWLDRVYQTHVAPLRDVLGNVEGCIGVALDITERRRAEQEVERSREQLRHLARRLQSIREEEQQRIAREIHDEFGQRLTALRLDLAWLGGRLEQQHGLRERIGQMIESVDATIDSLREIAAQLRPPMLDDLGLSAAVEWLTQSFTQQTGIPCAFEGQLPEGALDPAHSVAAFRIVQEALTNVARHARASRVSVRGAVEGGGLVVVVADNGRGISDQERANPYSLGLAGMRERALAVGGQVAIHSDHEGGTRVELRLCPDSGTGMKVRR